MTKDISYRHPETGQERLLPEGLGEQLGYKRVNEFNPPELGEQSTGEKFQTQVEAELDHAISQLSGIASNGADQLSEGVRSKIMQLVNDLEEYGFTVILPANLPDSIDFILAKMDEEEPDAYTFEQLNRIVNKVLEISTVDFEGQQEQTSGLTALEALTELEKKIEANSRISATAKTEITKHISQILSAQQDAADGDKQGDQSGSADQTSTATTEPLEQNMPGKSDGDSQASQPQ